MVNAAKEYVESRSIPIPVTGCWVWMRSIGSHGYGNARIDGRNTVAHRVSYAAFNGPIPHGMLVQHSCDNKWCVAPHHLSIGTDATNAIDKQMKGRAARKLSADDVRAIRTSPLSTHAVARAMGISRRAAQFIRRRVQWRHVA